jgi:hypothetical protein
MANIQLDVVEILRTEEWQKDKEDLFIKPLVKIQCRNRRRNGII